MKMAKPEKLNAMIGIHQSPRDPAIITAQGLPVAKLFSSHPNGYDIYDFRGRHVGWAITEFVARTAVAAHLLWRDHEWEQDADGTHWLVTPSHHATIEPSQQGWTATLINDITGSKTSLAPDHSLIAAKARVDNLIRAIDGFRSPPPTNLCFGLADCVDSAMLALRYSLPSMYGFEKDSLGCMRPRAFPSLMELVEIFDAFASTLLDLTGLLHSVVASEVKRLVLAIHNRNAAASPYAAEALDLYEGPRLDDFRIHFSRSARADRDYTEFVWRELIFPLQRQQGYPTGGEACLRAGAGALDETSATNVSPAASCSVASRNRVCSLRR